MEERLIKVGITHGDINGIGYEIILKTFSDSRITELCTPVLYGSSKIAAYYRKTLELPQLNICNIARAEEAANNRVNIINCINDDTKVELGQSTQTAGMAAFKSLENAVADLKKGVIDVLLTTPINIYSARSDKFNFSGQTEYLEKQFSNGESKALMMLISDDLRIALATGLIPISDVAPMITKENITEKLSVFNRSLIEDFNIIKPRIAVLSLNPGIEGGDPALTGNEEERVIVPAMQEAEKEGVMSFGPYAADNFFGSEMYEKFDGVLAMYHDQGLAPFKALALQNGIQYTAGLSIVRTSPAHGTGYDIAGQNNASEESFRNALYTAIDIYRSRKIFKDSTRNPLRKQYYDKGNGEEKLDLTKDEEPETL